MPSRWIVRLPRASSSLRVAENAANSLNGVEGLAFAYPKGSDLIAPINAAMVYFSPPDAGIRLHPLVQ